MGTTPSQAVIRTLTAFPCHTLKQDLRRAAGRAASYAHAALATDKLVPFHYGNDTYVYNDDDSDGTVSAHDGIVKLAGVTTALTSTNFIHG